MTAKVMTAKANTLQLSPPELQQREQIARLRWTGFIILFFVIQAVIWTVAISLTTNDASHAVVQDFGKQSVVMPSESERLEANKVLGWSATLTVAPANRVASDGMDVTLIIHDRSGEPVELSAIELSAFHCGQAARVQRVELTPAAAGTYLGTVRVSKPGQWQFDSVIHHENQTYYFSDRQGL